MAKIFNFYKTILPSAVNWANGFQRTVKTATTSPRVLSWVATASCEYTKYDVQCPNLVNKALGISPCLSKSALQTKSWAVQF